jgi:tetratricopeptide (TPR) repeat protein
MPALIGIALIILLIYLIVKLIIWLTPYVATSLVFALGAGSAIGLLVGIFYAIKNYMASILENIHSNVLKVTMVIITCLSTLALLSGTVYTFVTVGEGVAVKRALEAVVLHKNNGVNYAVHGAYDMAVEEFTKAIGVAKNDTTLATLYELRGRALIAKSASESVSLLGNNFKDIAVARPKQVPRGIIDRAIDDFSTAIKLNPENPVYYRERGRAYNWIDKDDKAIDDFDSAIRLNPNYVVVYNSRGILYAKRNEDSLAIVDYSKAIQLDPNFIYAYRNRGGVYARNNEFGKAISDFETALQIDPNDADAKWGLKQVKNNQRTYKKQRQGQSYR